MSGQAIVDRIISDAEEEARAILKNAADRADKAVKEETLRAERNMRGTQAEAEEKAKSILDGKAATARLDCAKILLAEKRGVIDEIYARALNQLIELSKAETLRLCERLLTEYAEEGDEIIFADSFRYRAEISALDIVKEKKLKVSAKTSPAIKGGFVLSGKISDKDLSYSALLTLDREEYQSEIAGKIFITG